MTYRMFAFAAALSLPLCASASAQVPATIDLQAIPPLSGSWTYRLVAGGSEADYFDSSASVRLEIRCNRAARTVSIIRTGAPHAAATLSIWTTTMSRSVPSRFLASNQLIADLAASDPLLDALAFSSGRFATAADGAPMVAVAAMAEPVRVIEDCRS